MLLYSWLILVASIVAGALSDLDDPSTLLYNKKETTSLQIQLLNQTSKQHLLESFLQNLEKRLDASIQLAYDNVSTTLSKSKGPFAKLKRTAWESNRLNMTTKLVHHLVNTFEPTAQAIFERFPLAYIGPSHQEQKKEETQILLHRRSSKKVTESKHEQVHFLNLYNKSHRRWFLDQLEMAWKHHLETHVPGRFRSGVTAILHRLAHFFSNRLKPKQQQEMNQLLQKRSPMAPPAAAAVAGAATSASSSMIGQEIQWATFRAGESILFTLIDFIVKSSMNLRWLWEGLSLLRFALVIPVAGILLVALYEVFGSSHMPPPSS